MDARWARLGRLVDAERARRRLSWAELARDARIGVRTLHDIHHGTRGNYTAEILTKLESALWWEPGSVERVLAGRGDPVRIPDPHRARIDHAWPDLPLAARAMLADLADRSRL